MTEEQEKQEEVAEPSLMERFSTFTKRLSGSFKSSPPAEEVAAAEPKVEAEAEPEVKAEAEPEVKAEAEAEPEPEVKAEAEHRVESARPIDFSHLRQSRAS